MKYEDAVKKIQTKKPTDNYMIIETGYDSKILLPYKDGITLMSALVNAEKYQQSYGEGQKIIPMNPDNITSKILSREEYELIKVANLLNMSVDQLREQTVNTVVA